LKQALQSIAEQEYTASKIEVVLVDDGSTLPEAQAGGLRTDSQPTLDLLLLLRASV